MLFTGITGTSNSFNWLFPSADTGNTIQGNVLVIDSATTSTSANSVKSSTITLNSALAFTSLTSNPVLPSTQNEGNTITFNSVWSGGTSPYTVNYIITNTITKAIVANMLFTSISGTTNSFAWIIPKAVVGNTLQANVIITDSATTPEIANSIYSNTLTVIGAQAILDIFPSNQFPEGTGDSYILAESHPLSDGIYLYINNQEVAYNASGTINYGLSARPSGTYTVNSFDLASGVSSVETLYIQSSQPVGSGSGVQTTANSTTTSTILTTTANLSSKSTINVIPLMEQNSSLKNLLIAVVPTNSLSQPLGLNSIYNYKIYIYGYFGATVAILIVIALAIIMTYVLFFIPNGTTADGKQKRGNGNYALIILAIILVVLGFGTFIG